MGGQGMSEGTAWAILLGAGLPGLIAGLVVGYIVGQIRARRGRRR